MRDENCVFCKIVNGELPSYGIYEDEYFKVVLDIFPANVGHTIIITKEHYENVYALPDETAAKLFVLAKKIAVVLKNHLNLSGLNIMQNNGASAGQTVSHFHLHLVPRAENDGITIAYKPLKLDDKDFASLKAALSASLT